MLSPFAAPAPASVDLESASLCPPPLAQRTAAVVRACRELAELPGGFEHHGQLSRAPLDAARALLWGAYRLDVQGWRRLLQRSAALVDADTALSTKLAPRSHLGLAAAIRQAERTLSSPRSLSRPEARLLLAALRDPETEDRALDFLRALYGDEAPNAAWRLCVLAAASARLERLCP